MGDARGTLKQFRRMWFLVGGLRVFRQEIFGFEGRKLCIPMLFWVILPQYPYPHPLKNLFRFTLISRMILGLGKKSEIRLKSEDSVPWRRCGGEQDFSVP